MKKIFLFVILLLAFFSTVGMAAAGSDRSEYGLASGKEQDNTFLVQWIGSNVPDDGNLISIYNYDVGGEFVGIGRVVVSHKYINKNDKQVRNTAIGVQPLVMLKDRYLGTNDLVFSNADDNLLEDEYGLSVAISGGDGEESYLAQWNGRNTPKIGQILSVYHDMKYIGTVKVLAINSVDELNNFSLFTIIPEDLSQATLHSGNQMTNNTILKY